MSLDGHDKLCGFQKSLFPLAIYGGQDAFSGRINMLRIWTTNNRPEIIGRFYYDYLCENKSKYSKSEYMLKLQYWWHYSSLDK